MTSPWHSLGFPRWQTQGGCDRAEPGDAPWPCNQLLLHEGPGLTSHCHLPVLGAGGSPGLAWRGPARSLEGGTQAASSGSGAGSAWRRLSSGGGGGTRPAGVTRPPQPQAEPGAFSWSFFNALWVSSSKEFPSFSSLLPCPPSPPSSPFISAAEPHAVPPTLLSAPSS